MARLRASWRTSLPVVQQPRNPQSESIARSPYHSCPSDAPVRDEAARFEPGEWPIGGRAHQRPRSLRADVGAQLIAGERPCAWDHGDWLGRIAQSGLASGVDGLSQEPKQGWLSD